MLSSELSSSDLSQRVKQFQGSGSIHTTILLETTKDQAGNLCTAVGTMIDADNSSNTGVDCHSND